MILRSKTARVAILAMLCIGLLILALCWPVSRVTVISLPDGSTLTLASTDSGSKLCYGGGSWQRLVCKAAGRRLPPSIHNQPAMWSSIFTNGIALFFRRQMPGGNLPGGWKGTNQLYYLDDSGVERAALNHCVNFQTEKRGQAYVVTAEETHWELPMLHKRELHLRIRETYSSTGSISTHDFEIENPAL
jgi:hypothetical protein